MDVQGEDEGEETDEQQATTDQGQQDPESSEQRKTK